MKFNFDDANLIPLFFIAFLLIGFFIMSLV